MYELLQSIISGTVLIRCYISCCHQRYHMVFHRTLHVYNHRLPSHFSSTVQRWSRSWFYRAQRSINAVT